MILSRFTKCSHFLIKLNEVQKPWKKNEHLLGTRRFLPMFVTQFFGALNDNVYKQALLLVITYGWINQQSADVSTLNNLAALLFILPYLFSLQQLDKLPTSTNAHSLYVALKFLKL